MSGALALKEWAVIIEALAKGKQLLLFRKGGLIENHTGFSVPSQRFLLFPTYFHQDPDLLIPALRLDVERLQKLESKDAIRFEYYAELKAHEEIKESQALDALEGFHIWSRQGLDERLKSRSQDPLHILVLRVYRLDQVCELPYHEDYGGCTSWVRLHQSVELEGKSVLSEEIFQLRMDEIKEALGAQWQS